MRYFADRFSQAIDSNRLSSLSLKCPWWRVNLVVLCRILCDGMMRGQRGGGRVRDRSPGGWQPSSLARQDENRFGGFQQVLLRVLPWILLPAPPAHPSSPASGPPRGPASAPTPGQTRPGEPGAPCWGPRICGCWWYSFRLWAQRNSNKTY